MYENEKPIWQLPDHLADILPKEAKQIERWRRCLIDMAENNGYELVIPPLLEHLDALLSGTGESLGLRTFQVVDQLSGRTLGLRADTTPQVARIDAHLLGSKQSTRLCYCGPVLHTQPAYPGSSREPLQFGAELFGESELEGDLEIVLLALECLRSVGLSQVYLSLAHTGIAKDLLELPENISSAQVELIYQTLASKDMVQLKSTGAVATSRHEIALNRLMQANGGEEVLRDAEDWLAEFPRAMVALEELQTLKKQLQDCLVGSTLGFDLADMQGHSYYTGLRFSVHTLGLHGQAVELLRGGRYDGIGYAFGRSRPAVGFSLDIKNLLNSLKI
jgi:ATP phosphoribosyltransferase regulatory subunit